MQAFVPCALYSARLAKTGFGHSSAASPAASSAASSAGTSEEALSSQLCNRFFFVRGTRPLPPQRRRWKVMEARYFHTVTLSLLLVLAECSRHFLGGNSAFPCNFS